MMGVPPDVRQEGVVGGDLVCGGSSVSAQVVLERL